MDNNKSIIVDLTQPNTTQVVSNLLVHKAEKDLPSSKDPSKLLAITTLVDSNGRTQKFWNRNNELLASKGDVIDIIVDTENKIDINNPESECYSNVTLAPAGFFNKE